MSIQNIMNTCFAICITLLIYQNNQLKNDVSQNHDDIRLVDEGLARNIQQIKDSIIDEYDVKDIIRRCNIQHIKLGDSYSISC